MLLLSPRDDERWDCGGLYRQGFKGANRLSKGGDYTVQSLFSLIGHHMEYRMRKVISSNGMNDNYKNETTQDIDSQLVFAPQYGIMGTPPKFDPPTQTKRRAIARTERESNTQLYAAA